MLSTARAAIYTGFVVSVVKEGCADHDGERNDVTMDNLLGANCLTVKSEGGLQRTLSDATALARGKL